MIPFCWCPDLPTSLLLSFLPSFSPSFLITLHFYFTFYYLTERGREYKNGGVAEAEAEAGSPLSRELDTELDPRTLGS